MAKRIRARRAENNLATGADRRIIEAVREFLNDPSVTDDDLVEACGNCASLTPNAVAFQINMPRTTPTPRPRTEQGRKVRLTSADYDNPDRVWD